MFTKQEYKVVAEHRELNKVRTVRSSEKVIAEKKSIFLHSIWDKKWQKKNRCGREKTEIMEKCYGH